MTNPVRFSPSLVYPTDLSGDSSPQGIWKRIEELLGEWFHAVDTEALLITILGNYTHFYESEKPLWILLLGPSGSGKTEIVITANTSLHGSKVIGDITPAAFLSSYNRGPKNSLLPPSGGNSIWLIKDFTTICSMRSDSLKEVATRFREVWDGEFNRETGVGPSQTWKGKVTCLAVGTPNVEQSWGAMRTMGERFLYLRWRTSTTPADNRIVMQKVRKQMGQESEIRRLLAALTNDLVSILPLDTEPPPNGIVDQLDETADIVAKLRTNVLHDGQGAASPIVGVDSSELPTRIAMGVSQIFRTHQALFQHPPYSESLQLAHRLARDTIPAQRMEVLKYIPYDFGAGKQWGWIANESRIPPITLYRVLEELASIGVLDHQSSKVGAANHEHIAEFDRDFLARCKKAGLIFT